LRAEAAHVRWSGYPAQQLTFQISRAKSVFNALAILSAFANYIFTNTIFIKKMGTFAHEQNKM
jgi:hypothetical protein